MSHQMHRIFLAFQFGFVVDDQNLHECTLRTYIIHFSSPVTKKSFLRCLKRKERVEMAGIAVFMRYPLSEFLYFLFYVFLFYVFLFCIFLTQLSQSKLAQSTPNCSASSFCVCDGFSFDNPFKSSALNQYQYLYCGTHLHQEQSKLARMF